MSTNNSPERNRLDQSSLSDLIADTEKMLNAVSEGSGNGNINLENEIINLSSSASVNASDIELSSSSDLVSDLDLSITGKKIKVNKLADYLIESSSDSNDLKSNNDFISESSAGNLSSSSNNDSFAIEKRHSDDGGDSNDDDDEQVVSLKAFNTALLNAGLPIYRFKNLDQSQMLEYFTDIVNKMSKSHDELLTVIDEINVKHESDFKLYRKNKKKDKSKVYEYKEDLKLLNIKLKKLEKLNNKLNLKNKSQLNEIKSLKRKNNEVIKINKSNEKLIQSLKEKMNGLISQSEKDTAQELIYNNKDHITNINKLKLLFMV